MKHISPWFPICHVYCIYHAEVCVECAINCVEHLQMQVSDFWTLQHTLDVLIFRSWTPAKTRIKGPPFAIHFRVPDTNRPSPPQGTGGCRKGIEKMVLEPALSKQIDQLHIVGHIKVPHHAVCSDLLGWICLIKQHTDRHTHPSSLDLHLRPWKQSHVSPNNDAR